MGFPGDGGRILRSIPGMSVTPPRFRAFISYSHQDRAWADWLHKAVETYRVPAALIGRQTAKGPVPARLFPLFRDREELAASADLSEAIRDALNASEHLIVICSPAAAASRWVNEEVLAFKRTHGEDRIFALIVAGSPGSDDLAVQCFPPALGRRLDDTGEPNGEAIEPAAADARDSGDGRANARLKLIAGLLGVGLGELTGREAAAQRRRMRVTQGLAALFALLAIAAVWFAISSERQRARAEANLQSGIGAAQTMIFEIAQKSSGAIGAQRSVLIAILKQAQALLDDLSKGQTLSPAAQRNAAAAQHELADAFLRAGDATGALAATERSVAIIETLLEAAPDDAALQRDLSVSLEKRGDAHAALDEIDPALADFQRSRDIRMALAARPEAGDDARFDLAIAYGKLAAQHFMLGDIAAASENYQAQLQLDQALMAADGDNPAYLRDTAIALDGLARCRLAGGDVATALATAEDVTEIRSTLATLAPNDAEAARDLAVAQHQLGIVRMAAENPSGALTALDAAIAIWQRLSADDPSDVELRFDLAMTRLDAGDALGRLGEFGAAGLRYTLAVTALEEVVKADPATARYSAGLATGLAWLAGIRVHEHNLTDAEDLLNRALEIRERLAAARPGDRKRRYDLAVIYFSLAAFEGERGDLAKSITWFEKAEAVLARLVQEKPDTASSQLLDMIRLQIARLRESAP